MGWVIKLPICFLWRIQLGFKNLFLQNICLKDNIHTISDAVSSDDGCGWDEIGDCKNGCYDLWVVFAGIEVYNIHSNFKCTGKRRSYESNHEL